MKITRALPKRKKVTEPGDLVVVDANAMRRNGRGELDTALDFDREYEAVNTSPHATQLRGLGWFPSWMFTAVDKGEK